MYLPTVEALKLVITSEASRLLTRISQILAKKNIPSYLVGGFVRDMLLGRATDDIDIAVNADALDIASRVAQVLAGRYVLLDKDNGVARVIIYDNKNDPARGKWEIDFAALQGTIRSDLARRDFTIDAMAIELEGEMEKLIGVDYIIDPFHGQEAPARPESGHGAMSGVCNGKALWMDSRLRS